MSKEQVKLAEKEGIKYRETKEGYTEGELTHEVNLGYIIMIVIIIL